MSEQERVPERPWAPPQAECAFKPAPGKQKAIPIPSGPGIASTVSPQIAPNGQPVSGYWCPAWRVELRKYERWMLIGQDKNGNDALVIPYDQFAQWVSAAKCPDSACVYGF